MSYAESGYRIYKDFFSNTDLENWEGTVKSIFYHQAKKMGFDSWDMDELVRFFENHSKQAGYHCALQCEQSLGGKQFVALDKFYNLLYEHLDCVNNFLTVLGPVLLTNIPESKRLIYRWHSEFHFHPKRKNFVNIWIPMFREKRDGAGTVVLAEGTHKKHWDFVEYSGYDESDLGNKQAYMQYEAVIDEPLKEIVIELDRKDLLIFHGNLLHKSTVNNSDNVTYATSIRVFDTSKDPSLSSKMAQFPYNNGDVGYPGLKL